MFAADYLLSSETWSFYKNGVCPCDFGFVSGSDGVCFVLLFVPMLWRDFVPSLSGRLCACSFLYVGFSVVLHVGPASVL